jgi:hypothetical protein
MLELTPEQRRALVESAAPPSVVDPDTKQEYVLVRADDYARLRAIADGIAKRAGWDDPALDVYESYRKSS